MEAKKTLRIGNSDFKRIVSNNHYFVDKTMLAYDFFLDTGEVILFPRPRRFGKTLNLSMIEHFFDISKAESKDLFAEFKIAQHKDFCKKHQNKYPVIALSLKKIKALNWEDCLSGLKNAISTLYKEHKYLLKSDKLEGYEKEEIENIISKKASQIDYKLSLKSLSGYLKSHFGKNVIILLDEYDTAIIYSYEATFGNNKRPENQYFYEKTIDFMRTFLGEAFKGNQYLEKGLITGIMRIARESIFSEMNNLTTYAITSNYFSDSFGFTEAEVKKILAYYDLENNFSGVQKWYNGYRFGRTEKIYNPWSIVNYIANSEDGFKAHWVNTGSDVLIKKRITEPNVKEDLKRLISGENIEKTISETFVFTDFEQKEELLWTLLLHAGYLTTKKELSLNRYELKIPNLEIQTVFQSIILEWAEVSHKFNKDLLITTTEHLVNNRIPEFAKGFKRIMGDTLSYFDTAGNPEKIYHAYTLGMLAILTDDYVIKSNRESGEGRYDILLLPKDKNKYGIVIEIKQIEKKETESKEDLEKRIDKNLKKALQQIDENHYYKELLEHDVKLENIIKIPVLFLGKEAFLLNAK